MPVRTLNYTGRKRIYREDARVSIQEEQGGNFFDADLKLEGYDLPDEARVFVEAYRQARYMRFNFGQVGEVRIPQNRILRDFDSTEGVLFRVKVVTETDPRGLLLAAANQIRPHKAQHEDESRSPLLPVVPDDNMGDEIWRLEFDGQQTLLKVNPKLGGWREMARDPPFIALIYPAVLRAVLWRILVQEKHRDTEDMDDWRSRWLHFAVNLPSISNPPDESEEDPLDDWIDGVASAFCRLNNIRTTYERYWTGAQEP